MDLGDEHRDDSAVILAISPLCAASKSNGGAGVPKRVAKKRMTAVDARHDLTQAQETAAVRRQRRLEAFDPGCRRYIAELTCCAGELEDRPTPFRGCCSRW